jgi:hypothetical protein
MDSGALLDVSNGRERLKTVAGVDCVNPKMSHADILASMTVSIKNAKPECLKYMLKI